MPYTPPPEIAALSLEDIAKAVAERRLPPVSQWHPEHTGDSGMMIAADGRWLHNDSPIARPAMVRAFSSLLRREADGSHWLVTPQQRLAIAVEDAAFVATDVEDKGGTLVFRLNTDELVMAGPDNAVVARGDPEAPALYLAVRGGMEARLNRSTYEQLARIALERGDDWWVESGGARFSLVPRPS